MRQELLQQLALQQRLADQGKAVLPTSITTVGEFVDYVQAMHRFLNMEIEEILQLVPVDARKPWKATHESARSYAMSQLVDAKYLQEEAVDALCFMMNICLACGLTPDNIRDVFERVSDKNHGRIDNEY